LALIELVQLNGFDHATAVTHNVPVVTGCFVGGDDRELHLHDELAVLLLPHVFEYRKTFNHRPARIFNLQPIGGNTSVVRKKAILDAAVPSRWSAMQKRLYFFAIDIAHLFTLLIR